MMLLRSGMSDGAAVNMLRGWMNSTAGDRDGRWQSRYDDIPRAVSTARAKIGDHAEEDSGASGGDDAQSKRILSMANRGMHPDKEIEPIVLGETLGSRAWDALTWAEKREIALIRARIRSALRKLNSEIDQTKGEIPPWVHSDFHVEWYRIQISGGWPNLIRLGHACRVVDVRPKTSTSAPSPSPCLSG
jgi:hypothetical protein